MFVHIHLLSSKLLYEFRLNYLLGGECNFGLIYSSNLLKIAAYHTEDLVHILKYLLQYCLLSIEPVGLAVLVTKPAIGCDP
jgi:hypothetical protein